MPNRHKKRQQFAIGENQQAESAEGQTDKSESECSSYNLPGRFIGWLENPRNLQTFQTYLMIQSVVLAIFYSWYQSQVENY